MVHIIPDLKNFYFDLIGMLVEPHKQVEAKNGYIGECQANCKCSNGVTHCENQLLQINQLQCTHQEQFNKKFRGTTKKFVVL